MIDITFIPNGLNLSRYLSTYAVTTEVNYKKVITTMDGTEHAFAGKNRRIISFSLVPLTEEESAEVYYALYPMKFGVEFTNPYTGQTENRRFRLITNLEAAFLLKSIDGKRRYKGDTIQLREI